MNWSTRRTVISRSAKCFECRQNEFAHVALIQRTSARGEPPFQVEVPQPDDELPEGAAGGEVPESGREVVALSQARLQRMLGSHPGETRGFDATQLAIHVPDPRPRADLAAGHGRELDLPERPDWRSWP